MWLREAHTTEAVLPANLSGQAQASMQERHSPTHNPIKAKEATRSHQELGHIKYFSFSRAVRGEGKANPGNQMCVAAMQRTKKEYSVVSWQQLSIMASLGLRMEDWGFEIR